MMTDRFDAQLREHLLETANERPADGQLAAVVKTVAVTRQRHPFGVRLTWFPRRFGQFPAIVRYGVIAAALVLAAVAGAILAGGGGTPRTTVFEGTWTAIDPSDGSTLNLYVGAGRIPTVRFEDLHASGDVCLDDQSKVFTAEGFGQIAGKRLMAGFPGGGGCGLMTISIGGVYVYDPSADTLLDQDGVTWRRVPGDDGPVPTLEPEPFPTSSPSPIPRTVFEGRWTATDPGDQSTLTLIVGAGTEPVVQFQDDLSTGGACDADDVKIFRADGFGVITGNSLEAMYPDGGGCGSVLVPIAGLYEYGRIAGTDILVDQDAVKWTRVTEPLPTLRPAPTASGGPVPTLLGGCVNLRGGGTYTALDLTGSMSVTATVPGSPVYPWYGSREMFELAGSCEDGGSPMAFHASGATHVEGGGCMSSVADVTDFAEAIARLDEPQGDDISERIDLTIDGHPAARYDVANLSTCPGFGLWGGTILGEGETGSIYVIDVDGVLIEIELNRDGSQTSAELEETYAIIASLQFGP